MLLPFILSVLVWMGAMEVMLISSGIGDGDVVRDVYDDGVGLTTLRSLVLLALTVR